MKIKHSIINYLGTKIVRISKSCLFFVFVFCFADSTYKYLFLDKGQAVG